MRSIALECGMTVLLVDINGSRELKTLLPLLDSYKMAMKPRLIICKNHKLASLLRSTELSQDVLSAVGCGAGVDALSTEFTPVTIDSIINTCVSHGAVQGFLAISIGALVASAAVIGWRGPASR